MQDLANIFIKSIFIDNMVFAYFLGMCSYLAVSKTVKTSVGMGAAVIHMIVRGDFTYTIGASGAVFGILLAFGMMFIEVQAVLGEGEGIVDGFESRVKEIDENVGQIEALEMGRL